MPTDPTPGRSFVSRRAVVDIVRAAALGSYGITGLDISLPERALAALGLAHPGIRVRLGDPIDVELDLTIAYGLPVAEVARQVESAVRYGVGRALGRDVGTIAIHVGGLRVQPGGPPPAAVTADRPAGADAVAAATDGDGGRMADPAP